MSRPPVADPASAVHGGGNGQRQSASDWPSDGVYVSGGPGRRPGDNTPAGSRMRRRRAFTLVALTLVLPGAAQLAAGNRRLGRFGLRVWLTMVGLVIGVGLLFLVSRSTALGLVGRPWLMLGLQWLLTGFAALWAVLFVDAWRLGRPSGLVAASRRWLTGLTVALLVVTSGGLVYAAQTVGAGREALGAVFQGNSAIASTNGRYNILLLGADSGSDRVGTRPDSIQLVSIDENTGRAVTFGFSRDTENIDFRPGSTMARLMPGGWNCGDQCLLNGLYTWGKEHAAMFPTGTRDPGIVATREAVEALSGLDVHYYVMIDLKGFRKMVDALGGLDITVKHRTPIGGGTSPIIGWIEPGHQHLDGYHALWYARSRQGSTNYERMARQRCVTAAMASQLDPQTVLLRFQKIASASTGMIQTDLPQSELGRFADLAIRTRSQKIRSVNFVPPLIKPWAYDPTVVTSTVRAAIAASEKAGSAASKSHAPAKATPVVKPKPQPGTAVQDAAKAAGNAAETDLSSVCSSSS